MISAETPLDQLPRYVHPETGAPWFACPACGSHHVRGQMLETTYIGFHGVLQSAAAGGWCRVPGADRAVELHAGRPDDGDEHGRWLACGACAHRFRPDGSEVRLDHLPPRWHVIEDADAVAATGAALTEHIQEWMEPMFEPLRDGLPLGAAVYVQLAELRVHDAPYLDEPYDDGASGVHVHPRNYEMGVPAWCTAPFTDDAEWPAEAFFEGGSGRRIAYDFSPYAMPGVDAPKDAASPAND